MDWTRRRPEVICIGLSATDHIWRVERLPDDGLAKTRATDFAQAGGGMAATAAVTVARLGGVARFFGRGGDDEAGRFARAELAREGVDVAGYRLFAGARSSVSGVFVGPSGERHIANFRGGGLPDDPAWLPLDAVRQAGAVLADPRWPDGAAALFAAARAAGVPTVLDGDVAERAVFDRLLPLTDHAILSAPGLAGYGAGSDAAGLGAFAAQGCRVAAVTRGAGGVAWLEGGALCRWPAFPVAAVDTTGAGDVFHGAYAFAIAAGADVAESMSFAAAAAALKCLKPGGRDGIAGLDETIRFWKEHA